MTSASTLGAMDCSEAERFLFGGASTAFPASSADSGDRKHLSSSEPAATAGASAPSESQLHFHPSELPPLTPQNKCDKSHPYYQRAACYVSLLQGESAHQKTLAHIAHPHKEHDYSSGALSEAVRRYSEGESPSEIEFALQVPHGTFIGHDKRDKAGMPERPVGHQTVLSEKDEARLAAFIRSQAAGGGGLCRLEVAVEAKKLAEAAGTHFPGHDQYPEETWWIGFLDRHHLRSHMPNAISGARKRAARMDVAKQYLLNLLMLLWWLNLLPVKDGRVQWAQIAKHIWNFDETGARLRLRSMVMSRNDWFPGISKFESIQVVSGKEQGNVQAAQGDFVTGHLSIGVSISAEGHYACPAFLFNAPKEFRGGNPLKGKGFQGLSCPLPGSDPRVGFTPKGSMDSKHLFDYLKWWANTVTTRPLIMLADNHKSRYSLEIFELCVKEGIYLLLFPANSTGYLQPLDIAVWKSFKRWFKLLRMVLARRWVIDRTNIIHVALFALQIALEEQHGVHGFAQGGACPIQSSQLLPFVEEVLEAKDDSGDDVDWEAIATALGQLHCSSTTAAPAQAATTAAETVPAPAAAASSSAGNGTASWREQLAAFDQAVATRGVVKFTDEDVRAVAAIARQFHLPVRIPPAQPPQAVHSTDSNDGSLIADPSRTRLALETLLLNEPPLTVPTVPRKLYNKGIKQLKVKVNTFQSTLVNSEQFQHAVDAAGANLAAKEEKAAAKGKKPRARRASGGKDSADTKARGSKRKLEEEHPTRTGPARAARPRNLKEPDLQFDDGEEAAEWKRQVLGNANAPSPAGSDRKSHAEPPSAKRAKTAPAAEDSMSDSESSEGESDDEEEPLTISKGEFAAVNADDPEHKQRFILVCARQASSFEPEKNAGKKSTKGFNAVVYKADREFGEYSATDTVSFVFWQSVLVVPVQLVGDRILGAHQRAIEEVLGELAKSRSSASCSASSSMDTSS